MRFANSAGSQVTGGDKIPFLSWKHMDSWWCELHGAHKPLTKFLLKLRPAHGPAEGQSCSKKKTELVFWGGWETISFLEQK